jgi:hypothetical protein
MKKSELAMPAIPLTPRFAFRQVSCREVVRVGTNLEPKKNFVNIWVFLM